MNTTSSPTLIIPLDRSEVNRRVKRFREGCEMSRRQFGEVQMIRQKGEIVTIYTDKHTVHVPAELWAELGTVGEQAVAEHMIASKPVA